MQLLSNYFSVYASELFLLQVNKFLHQKIGQTFQQFHTITTTYPMQTLPYLCAVERLFHQTISHNQKAEIGKGKKACNFLSIKVFFLRTSGCCNYQLLAIE